jgi:hypothetical protein
MNTRKSKSFWYGGTGELCIIDCYPNLIVTDAQAYIPELFFCATCPHQE